jgi:hypothetical protein
MCALKGQRPTQQPTASLEWDQTLSPHEFLLAGSSGDHTHPIFRILPVMKVCVFHLSGKQIVLKIANPGSLQIQATVWVACEF